MRPDSTLFRSRSLLVIIVVGLAAFLGSCYLMIFGEDLASVGSDTFSQSAIGHKAFFETLQQLDIPANVSRFKSLEKAGSANLLVLAEPNGDVLQLKMLEGIKGEGVVLVVLPKWQGMPDLRRRQWLSSAEMVDADKVGDILAHIDPDATLNRRQQMASLAENRLGYAPAVIRPQLVRSAALSPLISTPDGILLGETKIGRAKVWLLTDPDLLNNAGLGKGDNALLAVGIIRALLPAGGSAIFDEAIHGFEQPPNMLRTAFELPFLTATIALILAFGTAILAGVTRLGAPAPAQPALAAGHETLLGNVADLLEFGHGAYAILHRYPRLVVADVALHLKVPKSLDENGQLAWLDQRARKLGLAHSASDLLAKGAALAHHGSYHHSAAELGRMAYQWKQEMMHGTRRHAVD